MKFVCHDVRVIEVGKVPFQIVRVRPITYVECGTSSCQRLVTVLGGRS